MTQFDYDHKPCIIFHSQSEIDDMCWILDQYLNMFTEVHTRTSAFRLAEKHLNFLREYHS
jgi:hypothetical protein